MSDQEIARRAAESYDAYAQMSTKPGHEESPVLLFIGDIDGHVESEMFFDLLPEQVINIRVPGAIVPPQGMGDAAVGAAIELALSIPTISDIVVCSHTECLMVDALAGAVDAYAQPNLARWITMADYIRARANTRVDPVSKPLAYRQALLELSVLRSLECLREFHVVRERESSGKLNLHGWYVDVAQEKLFIFQPASGKFATIDGDTHEAAPIEVVTDTPSPTAIEAGPVDVPIPDVPSVAPDRVEVPRARPVQQVYADEVIPAEEGIPDPLDNLLAEFHQQEQQQVGWYSENPAVESLRDLLTNLDNPLRQARLRQTLNSMHSRESWRILEMAVGGIDDPATMRILEDIGAELDNPRSREHIQRVLRHAERYQRRHHDENE